MKHMKQYYNLLLNKNIVFWGKWEFYTLNTMNWVKNPRQDSELHMQGMYFLTH